MVAARLLTVLLVLMAATALPARAQGPVTFGVPHEGHIADQLEEDLWTIAGVTSGDSLIVAATNLTQGGFVPEFLITGPTAFDSLYLNTSTASVARFRVTETGTFTLKAKSYQFSTHVGDYRFVVLKAPGTFTVPAGDQGGTLTSGQAVAGQAPAGDVDPWTFTGCVGATPRLQLNETPPDAGNQFNPAVHLFAPNGAHVDSFADTVAIDVTTLPLQAAGTYTLVVYGALGSNTGPSAYSLTVSGMCGSTPAPPTGQPDAYTTTINTALTVPAPGVLANDTSPGSLPMTASVVSQPQHGTVTLAANGGFTYTPTSGYTGADAFTYRPADANGQGNVTTVSIAVNAIAQPNPPTGLHAKLIAGNVVTLQWTPPVAGPVPTGYVLEGGLAPGDTIASVPTGSTNPVFSFGAPSGSFFVRMRTVAGALVSAASNEIVIHVNVPVPPSPPSGLLGMASGTAVALAWKNTYAGGAPTGLLLDVSGPVSASLPLALADLFTFPAVPPGAFTFSVRATNAAGTSAPSNSVALTFPQACSGVPQPPANLVAYRQGATLFVSWDPAGSGAAPTAYLLDVTGAVTLSLPVGPLRAVSGGVGPGTYTFRVAAANACGTSPLTGPVSVTIP